MECVYQCCYCLGVWDIDILPPRPSTALALSDGRGNIARLKALKLASNPRIETTSGRGSSVVDQSSYSGKTVDGQVAITGLLSSRLQNQ